MVYLVAEVQRVLRGSILVQSKVMKNDSFIAKHLCYLVSTMIQITVHTPSAND